MDTDNIHFSLIGRPGMDKGLKNRFIRILKLYIFTDKSDSYCVLRIFQPEKELVPLFQVRSIFLWKIKLLERYPVKPFFKHEIRNIIYSRSVYRLDNGFPFY